jgi:hypothetical protein
MCCFLRMCWRVGSDRQSITLTVYNYLRRGLFESDKLMVATLLCLKVRCRCVVHAA